VAITVMLVLRAGFQYSCARLFNASGMCIS
jgi:hypothetical protein